MRFRREVRGMNDIIREDMEEIYTRDIDWKALDGKSILSTGVYGMLASHLIYMLLYLCEGKTSLFQSSRRSKTGVSLL